MAPRPGGREGFCLPLSAEAPRSEIPYSTEQGIISEEQEILAQGYHQIPPGICLCKARVKKTHALL
jgi:hypothetical protein